MKKILGLDLGTNSIGWAVVNAETQANETKAISIEAAGSRIIPMDAGVMGDFERGNSISQTADRTKYRGIRRLLERSLLRRERLHRVLNLMRFLPEHYSAKLDRHGKFIDDSEPKLPWRKDENGKSEFLFQESFTEMCREFKSINSEIKSIPSDWTIYYLRKKALTQPITKYELAWILLNFNQKRGYYQLREEETEVNKNKIVEYLKQKVIKVESGNEEKGVTWYNIHLENGMIYHRKSKTSLDNWVGKTREFIVTTELNDDGTPKSDKNGDIKRSFRAPEENDWNLIKIKTEKEITDSSQTVGAFIYNALLQNPQQKIIGKLVRVIERKYYKEEILKIIQKQKEFISELKGNNLLLQCIEELYPSNEIHKNILLQKDFAHLFVEDILFYQRPLKSKKHLISDCPYEVRVYKKDNQIIKEPLKCVVKSHPTFQEFRLWQFISNLRIYKREDRKDGKIITDVDYTNKFLRTEEEIVNLFDFLNDKKEIGQDTLLSYFKLKSTERKEYRWNYVEDKKYPCNTTRASLLARLKKLDIQSDFLTTEKEEHLWHILYSINDKIEAEKALLKFAETHSLPDAKEFAIEFQKEIFKKDYASYSLKAIKKLLTLMRVGKYWNEANIDLNTKDRIEKFITGEFDEKIKDKVREKIDFNDISQFKGLPLWLACYIVYDRHSEAKEITKWESPDDIDNYLRKFRQHSMNNPIVEQIIMETLRVVRDIWQQVGSIDEIHLEMGRELKKTNDERKRISEQNTENENTNLRIKQILIELKNSHPDIENVRPHSPSQQEIFKIYENYALSNLSKENKEEYEAINSITKKANPTSSEVNRYKLWLEQQYQSPYTGKTIPLSKLFTSAYQIEHIIPQSRYFDNSFNNKVICESEVNQLKDKMLGYEFISNHGGEIVQLSGGGSVQIFTIEQYEDFINKHYYNTKKKNLLLTDIPDDFINRQLNDSRYISNFIKTLLSNIVRGKQENGEYEEEATSKNLITCTGKITDKLKQDWGVNDVWNKVILPRFKRLNELTNTNDFTALTAEGHNIPAMPLNLLKGFNKKRIDHRHHAMDAIVIACTTRNHVNLLNNEAALSSNKANRYQLQYKLRERFKTIVNGKEQEVFGNFYKPWESFTQDTYKALTEIVVSFKQNLRVINKTINRTQYINEDGKKKFKQQIKGDNWAIRKSLHKETVFGEVNLRKTKEVKLAEALANPKVIVEKEVKAKIIELQKGGLKDKDIIKFFKDNQDIWTEVANGTVSVYYFTKETKDRYFATRVSLDTSFNSDKIEQITDSGIQKILKAHLERNNDNPEIAFSPEGIEDMNKNIAELNKNKFGIDVLHQPIYKVRKYEKADKFAVGTKGNKSKKFVEAAKGTNLFFAIYQLENKRLYTTIPLNLVIDCQKEFKQNWKVRLDEVLKAKEYIDFDAQLLFIISPNDLVYLPTIEELKTKQYSFRKDRIYKFVSCTSNEGHFIPYFVASPIIETKELGSNNKAQRAWSGEMIKETCIPIRVDRLGNIKIE